MARFKTTLQKIRNLVKSVEGGEPGKLHAVIIKVDAQRDIFWKHMLIEAKPFDPLVRKRAQEIEFKNKSKIRLFSSDSTAAGLAISRIAVDEIV